MRPPTTRPWPPTGSSADDVDCHRTHRQHQHPRPTPSDAHRDLLEPDAGTTRTSGSEGAPGSATSRGYPTDPRRATPEQVAVARSGGGRTHLVAGYDHASGVTLGQVACAPEAGTGGELAAAQTLAAALDDRGLLADSVFTADAGFTARELAAELRSRGAHWILRVKGNQKMLHARLKALPWAQVPEAARVRSVGHGRVESRTIRVIDLTGSSDGHGEFFPDAAQALKIIRRRRDRHGRWSVETVYAITSLDARQAEPALLATWVRGHWSIEARLHWVRDMTFGEDHSQVRTDHGPTNLAALRTLAINALRLTGHTNIAAGLREHARTPLLPLVTLGLS